MKSFFMAGLVLFASLACLANQAHAQGGYGAPSLLPLPSVVPVDSSAVATNYNARTTSAYGSIYSSYQPQVQEVPPGAILPPQGDQHTAFGEQVVGDCGCGEPCCAEPACCHWFGAIGGLVMTRNRANPYWTTYETNNNPNQLMNTQNARADWVGGGQITVGYGFAGAAPACGDCCNPCGSCSPCGGCYGPGILFTYWGLGQMDGFSEINDPNNNLSTPINLGFVDIGANPASYYFDNAASHRQWRNDRVNNFEINVIQGPAFNYGRVTVLGLLGFRYFRFDERFTFGSLAGGFDWGDNGGNEEAYLRFRTVNNLYGAQIGALLNYAVCPRMGVFFIPKVGIFGNQMNSRVQLQSGSGITGTINDPGPQPFAIYGHKSDVSMLAELDTGLNFQILPGLWGFVGYRVLGINNVALADNQFLPYLADAQGYREIKQSGSLILHGGFAGLAFLY